MLTKLKVRNPKYAKKNYESVQIHYKNCHTKLSKLPPKSSKKGQNTWLKVYLNDKYVRAAMRGKTAKTTVLPGI